jgi:hypothetical protein
MLSCGLRERGDKGAVEPLGLFCEAVVALGESHVHFRKHNQRCTLSGGLRAMWSFEMMLGYLRGTATETGLKVKAFYDILFSPPRQEQQIPLESDKFDKIEEYTGTGDF